MTKSSRKTLLAALLLLPGFALAQTTTASPPAGRAAPPPRPAVVAPSQAQQNWQRAVDRSAIESSQRQSAVQEQLRQDNTSRQMNATSDPLLRSQLDNANRTQSDLYRSQQEDKVKRYNERNPSQPPPAGATSSGH